MINNHPSLKSHVFLPDKAKNPSACHIINIYSQFAAESAIYLRGFVLFARRSAEALRLNLKGFRLWSVPRCHSRMEPHMSQQAYGRRCRLATMQILMKESIRL